MNHFPASRRERTVKVKRLEESLLMNAAYQAEEDINVLDTDLKEEREALRVLNQDPEFSWQLFY
jgi:hypothetical protein